METLFTIDSLFALLTLTGMEIILGVDNIIFISILVGNLPVGQREPVRKKGIALALITRLLLLFSLSWMMNLKSELFSLFGHGFSGRDLILLGGGLFLVAKATFEIHDKLESGSEEAVLAKTHADSRWILFQIAILDIVFSLDSVVTAIGMANQIGVMVAAMVISVGVMLVSAKSIGDFVERHPTIKILALSFLLLIGVTLVAEGMGGHVNKGYIYFAMFFALGVEILNMLYLKRRKPAVIHFPKAD
jgi:predicted tellurium resistance membrane protein TerC